MVIRRIQTLAVLAVAACGSDDWPSVEPPDGLAIAFEDVWVVSETDVWFINNSPTISRLNGDAWTTTTAPVAVSCMFALSPTDMWFCAGEDVLHYDGSVFASVGSPGIGYLNDLWVSNTGTLAVVGENAFVARHANGIWQTSNIGSPFNSSVWGSADNDVYALGTFELSHWDGASWTDVALPGSGAGEGQIWGTAQNDVWLLSGSSTVLHFDGAAWTEVELDENMVGDLTAVWGPAPDDLWAVGSAGVVAHYDGSQWRQTQHQRIGAPYLQQLTDVHGTTGASGVTIVAVGYQLGENGSTPLLYRQQQ